MNKEDISNKLNSGQDVEFEYPIKGIRYRIRFLAFDDGRGINIPSIVAIPLSRKINDQFMLESNNLESGKLEEIIEQGGETVIRLAQLTNNLPTPIIVPLIPSYEDAPYFQQLSQECFSLSSNDRNYRIDEQVVSIIKKAKSILQIERGLITKNKIFLNGYSSSGVFAQRFALLHPEIVETACIGGASGSIPSLAKDIDYPIGIEDYETLTGKRFDLENYSKIKFKYYVGEFETQNKSDTRLDDFGNPAPKHDMSYYYRSVPTSVGKQQREDLGAEMFCRAEKTIKILRNLGIDIQHEIILGRSHNDSSGVGVNELGDEFIMKTYRSTIENKQKDDELTR